MSFFYNLEHHDRLLSKQTMACFVHSAKTCNCKLGTQSVRKYYKLVLCVHKSLYSSPTIVDWFSVLQDKTLLYSLEDIENILKYTLYNFINLFWSFQSNIFLYYRERIIHSKNQIICQKSCWKFLKKNLKMLCMTNK